MTYTGKQIDKAIGTFTTNRDKLRQLGHEICLMIAYHAAPKEVSDECSGSGEANRLLKFIEALPKSWVPQVQAWFELYTPIRRNGNKVGFALKYKTDTTENKHSTAWWNLEEAAQNPFWTVVEEKEQKLLDFKALVKLVEGLSGRIEKMVEEGKVAPDDIPSAKLMADTINHLHFKRVRPEPANNTAEEPVAEAVAA